MGDYLIGVDIGTQGVKAGLFDGSSGKCLAISFEPSRLHRPRPGVVEEDPERQVTSVCRTIRECVRRSGVGPRAVAGIAVDGQMAGVIGVDARGRHVTPYDSWLDTRCAPHIRRMARVAGDEILARTGCPPSFNHGPKILWWMHERPRTFRKVRSFVQPGGYAAMRLCGLDGSQAFIDPSYLHFSGFADTERSTWDADLCRTFALDPAKLPRIVASHAVVGELAPSPAGHCGLRGGVPVVAGCGDTAASFLSCGAVHDGICVDVAGTASVFATTTSSFRADRKRRTLACSRSAVPGLWHPYAYVNGGGLNLEWFRGMVAGDHGTKSRWTFERLNRLAASVTPRDDDPMFIPHLGGRVSPAQPELRGAWVGLDWSHTLGHLYRAVLEGVALEYGLYVKALRRLYRGIEPREVRVTGGGEKSAVWNRIKADVLGIPLVKLRRSEGAPLGSALLAGFGTGAFADLPQAAGRWIATGEITRPDRKRSRLCARRLARYERCIAQLNRWHEET